MHRFLIYRNRPSLEVEGTMLRKTRTHGLARVRMSNEIIEPELDPLKFNRAGMHMKWVVVIQGLEKINSQADYRVHISAVFNLTIWIGNIAHKRRPAELKVSEIIGVIHDLGPVGVDIQNTVLAAVPDQPGGSVAHEAPVAIV